MIGESDTMQEFLVPDDDTDEQDNNDKVNSGYSWMENCTQQNSYVVVTSDEIRFFVVLMFSTCSTEFFPIIPVGFAGKVFYEKKHNAGYKAAVSSLKPCLYIDSPFANLSVYS